ncbi:MAG: 30S ribosomal protein S17e [Methanoregula sp.]|jgi:small subunit ribosomal protein S17e|nr:30S ribosomal protein S17e [Methanoregula sp.]
MGIKPSYIKTLGLELLAKNREKFTSNYDENKQAMTGLALIDSKRVRNRVAGFITRKINTKRHQ